MNCQGGAPFEVVEEECEKDEEVSEDEVAKEEDGATEGESVFVKEMAAPLGPLLFLKIVLEKEEKPVERSAIAPPEPSGSLIKL